MSFQTRFPQGPVVDDYDAKQKEIVRPSPFGLRTYIAEYIGVDQHLNGL